VAEAKNARDVAALNLERTRVVAPLDGRLSDLSLRPGNYVAPGKPVLALVDTGSLRIEGYFEETKLPQVHIGQRATVRLMGESRTLTGHVTSIASAIEDHDRSASPNGLPAINPNFSWVRLAQRVPVRIALDNPPADVALISGRTATVTLDQGSKSSSKGSSRSSTSEASVFRVALLALAGCGVPPHVAQKPVIDNPATQGAFREGDADRRCLPRRSARPLVAPL
jgi:multidrug resistance efflux pump